MLKDYSKLALKNLRKRKLRSWLTITGIVISISVIFVLISLSLGLKGAIDEQFKILGTDKLFIMPKGNFGAGVSAAQLTTFDVDEIEKVEGVKEISYATIGSGEIEFNKQKKYFIVIGIPLDRMELFTTSANLEMDDGSELREGEKGKVMLGYDYKYNFVFDKPIISGNKIIINGKEFRVSGIVGAIGNPSDDKNIYMSMEDFKELFNSGNRVDQIIVQVDDEKEVKETSERIEKRLMKFRDVDEKTKDFDIATPEELLASFDIILNIITAFLVGIASISLFVGGVGIANTMYTSVLERTKEIGTMKAVGAKNRDILFIFLFESGLLGLIGGVIGVALGFMISKTVEFIAVNQLHTTLLKAASPAYLVVGSLVFAFLIGALSGGIPALKASKLKPVDALRYE
ncbi:MAG: ABC transporter permease [Candidatus Nanoarchaeia archaeon]|nr:ABC transporter permease [Candidatus Nanoarchaeia archaeon]MDD5358089.1 ABC transporter permease [Candidatus Nanoarchaeia archaeon]MDD5589277.1 ABC transporter permease [Candidatus Nanoarchaeia archaeon]